MSDNGNFYSTAPSSQINESEDTILKTVFLSDICQLSGLGDSLLCVFFFWLDRLGSQSSK